MMIRADQFQKNIYIFKLPNYKGILLVSFQFRFHIRNMIWPYKL